MDTKTAMGAAGGVALTVVGAATALMLTLGGGASAVESVPVTAPIEFVDQYGNPVGTQAPAGAPEIVITTEPLQPEPPAASSPEAVQVADSELMAAPSPVAAAPTPEPATEPVPEYEEEEDDD